MQARNKYIGTNKRYKQSSAFQLFARLSKLILIAAMLVFTSTAYAQEESKTKFMGKIGHWFVAYSMSSPDFIEQERLEFKSKAFAEVYVEGLIAHDAWMFGLLNKITKFRYEAKQKPHVLFEVYFKPTTDELDNYKVLFKITSSKSVSVNLDKIGNDVVSEFLNGEYAEPQEAIDDIQLAIKKALTTLAEKLGDQLAPNLMVKYDNEIFWDGHDIHILDDATNTIELEAIGKDGNPLNAADISWTNASPIASSNKATVDIKDVTNKEVLLSKGTDNLTVNITRLGVDPDINDLLKQLLIELLTVEQKEAQDTIVVLKQDSLQNLTDLRAQIALLEQYNFPLEDASGITSYVSDIQTLQDSSFFRASGDRREGFKLLRKRRRLTDDIKRKVNVAAFADLIVDEPERIKDLLEELVRNSGRLIARLILGRDSDGQRDAARDIVVDFLNRNLDRIANSNTEDTFVQVPLPVIVIEDRSKQPVFDASQRLYISDNVQFEGRAQFDSTMIAYLNQLETPTVMVVNYSQDVGTASYQNRTTGVRPIGLPTEYDFITINVVNIPGSVNEVSIFEGTSPLVVKARNAGITDVKGWKGLLEQDQEGGFEDYVKSQIVQLVGNSSKKVLGFGYCEKCEGVNSFSSEISDDNKIISLQGDGTKCIVYLYDELEDDVWTEEGEPSQEYLFELEGTFINGKSLFAFLNSEILDINSPLYACSNYIGEQLESINYCDGDEIDQQTFDLLYQIIVSCLENNELLMIPEADYNALQSNLDNNILKDERIKIILRVGDDQQNLSRDGLGEEDPTDYEVLFEENNGQWSASLTVSDDYLSSLGFTSSEISELQRLLGDLFMQSQVKFCQSGMRPSCFPEILTFLQVLNINLQSISTVGTTHPAMWDNDAYEDIDHLVPSDFKWHPVVGGAVDGAVDAAVSIPLLIYTACELIGDEEKQQALVGMFSEEGWDMLVDGIFSSLATIIFDEEKREHAISKASVELALAYYVALGKAAKGIKEALERVGSLAKKIDKSPNLQSYLKKIVKDHPDPVKAKKLESVLEAMESTDLERLMAKLDNDQLDNFIADLNGDASLAQKFAREELSVNSWRVLGESADLRKNIDALETIEFYTKNVNGNIDELADAFKVASNKEDWLSGVIKEIRSKARGLPGTSKGGGVAIDGKWMRGTEGNIGLFPKRIADKLKGRSFKNFAEFRSEFWKAVSDDPELFEQFGRTSKAEMLKGNAAFAKTTQQVGGNIKYEIHHKTPIHDGGEVYDIDNLVIVTPRYHKEILDPAYHYKK